MQQQLFTFLVCVVHVPLFIDLETVSLQTRCSLVVQGACKDQMNALAHAMQLFFQLISAFYGSSSSLAYAQLYRSSSAAHLGLHTSSFSSSFLPDIYIHADHMNTAAHIENGAQLARDK